MALGWGFFCRSLREATRRPGWGEILLLVLFHFIFHFISLYNDRELTLPPCWSRCSTSSRRGWIYLIEFFLGAQFLSCKMLCSSSAWENNQFCFRQQQPQNQGSCRGDVLPGLGEVIFYIDDWDGKKWGWWDVALSSTLFFPSDLLLAASTIHGPLDP